MGTATRARNAYRRSSRGSMMVRFPARLPFHANFETPSATLTDRAHHGGGMLPASAVSPPMLRPHSKAALGTRNAGKKAMGNFSPPPELIKAYTRMLLSSPLTAPINTA